MALNGNMEKWRMLSRILVLILLIGCITSSDQNNATIKYNATISEIIDGDTVELENGERVRLLGINTPEKGEICDLEAKDFLEQQVLGKEITLEVGKSNRDKYNRQLRYLWDNNKLINAELVKEGLAHVYSVGEEDKYAQILGQSQAHAITENKCIWKYSTEKYVQEKCVSISEFIYNTPGDDSLNPNGEQLILQNNCTYTIDLTGWEIKDEATNTFKFPEFEFSGQSIVNIYSGKGIDYSNHIFMNHKTPVWNNDHDSLFLRNEKGELVLYYNYEN